MFELLILGIIQGIAEWLPISSEGMIVLAKTYLFGGGRVDDMIHLALFLHMGTALASIVYFRAEIAILLKNLALFHTKEEGEKRELMFYIVATMVSGVLGYGLLKLVGESSAFATETFALTLLVGAALCVTGILQMVRRGKGDEKKETDATMSDSILLGILKGAAVIPGISRSGMTVAGLLFRGYTEEAALRMSFILSIPIVVAGNIVLNLNTFTWNADMFVGLMAAFVVGYVTIDVLLRVAKKVPFGPFVLAVGILVLISAFV